MSLNVESTGRGVFTSHMWITRFILGFFCTFIWAMFKFAISHLNISLSLLIYSLDLWGLIARVYIARFMFLWSSYRTQVFIYFLFNLLISLGWGQSIPVIPRYTMVHFCKTLFGLDTEKSKQMIVCTEIAQKVAVYITLKGMRHNEPFCLRILSPSWIPRPIYADTTRCIFEQVLFSSNCGKYV